MAEPLTITSELLARLNGATVVEAEYPDDGGDYLVLRLDSGLTIYADSPTVYDSE